MLDDDAEPDAQATAPAEATQFRFARAGAGDVSGAEALGLTWKTVESSQVVIELDIPDTPAARFFETMATDYDRTDSKAALSRLAMSAPRSSTLTLTTARNQAAGSVFGMVNNDRPFIVKVTGSRTNLSEIGTTVTLEGEYKH